MRIMLLPDKIIRIKIIDFYAIILCCFLFPFSLESQNPQIDSLKLLLSEKKDTNEYILRELSKEYTFINKDSSIHYIELYYSNSKNKSIAKIYRNYRYAYFLNYENEIDSALAIIRETLDLPFMLDNPNSFERAIFQDLLGDSYNSKGNYLKAIEFYTTSSKIYKFLGDDLRCATSISMIGAMNSMMGNFKTALDYYYQSEAIIRKFGGQAHINLLINICSTISETNTCNNIEYCYEALTKTKLNIPLHAIACLNIGLCHYKRNELDSAMYYWKKTLVDNSFPRVKFNALLNLSEANINQKKYAEALLYLRTCKDIKNINSNEAIYEYAVFNNLLSLCYEGLNKPFLAQNHSNESIKLFEKLNVKNSSYLKALRQNIKYNNYKNIDQYIYLYDSLNNYDYQARIDEIINKYENEKKSLENEKLTQENTIKSLQISQQRNALFGGGMFLLLLSGLVYYLFVQYRKISSQNNTIALLNSEITHRVKNQFVLATELLRRQKLKAEDKALQEIAEESEHSLNAIAAVNKRLDASSDYKSVDVGEVIAEVLDELHYSWGTINEKPIRLVKELDSIAISQDKATYLGLIINELYTNTYKYAFDQVEDPEVTVSLTTSNGSVIMMYADNGSGMTDAPKGTGAGLIERLSRQMHGHLKIEVDNGMKVKLEFPYEKQ